MLENKGTPLFVYFDDKGMPLVNGQGQKFNFKLIENLGEKNFNKNPKNENKGMPLKRKNNYKCMPLFLSKKVPLLSKYTNNGMPLFVYFDNKGPKFLTLSDN